MSKVRGVVVLVADQLRADHLGFGGGQVPTPHLDALAASGTVFDQAYVANPTCMPNRATIATGRWPSTHGTRTNGVTLDWDAQTFMRSMQRSGWNTAAVGKLHFQTMGWPYEDDQLADMARHAPELVDAALVDAVERGRPAQWDTWESFERHRPARLELPPDYYGFDTVDLVIGHGDAPGGHYAHWARARGLDPDTVRIMGDALVGYPGWDQVYQSEVPVELHPTTYVTERAIDRLEQLTAGDAPFCLFVSYPDPHHPFAPPGDYWHRIDPSAVELPATFFDTHDRSPEHVRQIVADRGRPAADPTMTWSPTEEQYRHALAAELGLVSLLDDSIGRILGRLEDLGVADDTAVVFTADHGDLFGDHGLMLKHFVHYQGVTRVPLIVRSPDGDSGRSSALVSSADIAPTLLDLGGVPSYRGIQGTSLRSLVEGRASAVRPRLLVEEDQPFGLPGLPGPVHIRTLLTEDARLTVYGGHDVRELYALDDDADETTNLADTLDGAALQARLTADLAAELIRLTDTGIRPAASA
ncbi:sulfatase [Nocardioides sp. SLBN-35]|uniref:sulfatase family protein n=1 Tax=Nocardioides sp. SLBN-35 TaxID=2768445 RepID=UPI0011546B69|nr:sulfatase-like hydrolase/transferase [Nocardioides sp. SLBN-35]TQK70286.1 arylsulfatase A-like enzyme [Nocardioides sp. SLBN-35]